MPFLKTVTSTLILVGVPGGALYISSGYDNQLTIFNFDGSSSMKPIIDFLIDEYKKESTTDAKSIAMNISAVGSGMGLRSIIGGTSEFSLISHDVEEISKGIHKEEWKKRKLKSIALAEEAMLVLYKPPKGCTGDFVIKKDNVKNFYSLMSGHVFDSSTLKTKLGDFMESKQGNCDVEISPWVKNSGPVKSGTAKAFVDNPLLKEDTLCTSTDSKQQECKDWLKKVKGGSYGEGVKLNYTPEPTPLHWESFDLNLTDGSVTYLPSSFVFLNWDNISKRGLKIAKLQPDSSVVELTKDNFSSNYSNYKWGRKFNLVYSVDEIKDNTHKQNMLKSFVKNVNKLSELKLNVFSYKLNGDTSTGTTTIDINEADKVEASS